MPVFVQVWSRPLITLSDRDTFADVLRTCGARNVFGAERMPAPQVGPEAVMRRAPRLIVAFGGAGQDGREPWARLGMLSPEGPVGFARVDPAIQRPTPSLLEPMARLCEAVDAVRAGSAAEPWAPGAPPAPAAPAGPARG